MAAPALGKIFDAALVPAPTKLHSKENFKTNLNTTHVETRKSGSINIRFVSIRFVEYTFSDSIQCVSICFVSIRFVSILFVSICFVSIRFVSICFVNAP
jgi:hypothetical protein